MELADQKTQPTPDKIDLVYKINDSSRTKNLELRYSLRSVEKNFPDAGNIWIIGYCPDFVDKSKVGFLEFPDTFSHKNKDANIIQKLSVACSIPEISYEFLNMSDDFIFLKKTYLSFFDFPLFNNSLVKNERDYGHLKFFDKRVIKTREILRNSGFNQDVYEAHLPYKINKNYASYVMRWPYHDGIGYNGNTLFFNTSRANGRHTEKYDVLRLNSAEDQMDELEKYRFLNFNHFAENQSLFDTLNILFPKKSKWEL